MLSPAPCPAKHLDVCWTWTCLRTSFTAMANWPYWPKSPGRGPDRSPTGARPQARAPQKISSKSIAGLPHSFSRNSSRCSRVGLKRSSLRLTAEDRLLPLFEPLQVSMLVCGHTHMQFDRMIGGTRVVNAGSVGMPFGEPGAYWLLLGPDVQLRRTLYDFTQAAEHIRGTEYPQAEDFAVQSVLTPPSEEKMLEAFTSVELK